MPCIVTSSHVWISLAEHANSNQRCHSPPQQLQTILPQCNNLGAGRSCCLLQRKASQDQAAPGHQQGHHRSSRAAAAWSQQGQAGGTLPRGATPKPAGQAEDGVIFVKPENIGVFVRVVALIGMPGCRPVYRMAPHTGAMQWAHCCSPRPACPETESPEGPPLL